MALDQVKNFCIVEVSTGYNSTDTSIVLKTGDGAKLPDPASGEYNLVWYDNTSYLNPTEDPNVEIVRVTALSTNTLTVTRNQEGSGASTKNTADKTYKMILSLTKKMLDDIGSNFDGIVGGTTPADGSFTTLSASGLISADGGQIKFPASQSESADANTLDDYEEGEFEPTVTLSTSGTYTMDANYKTGGYVKIGGVCHVFGFIGVSAESSPVGNLQIALPFTVRALTQAGEQGVSSAFLYNHGGTIPNGVSSYQVGATAFFILWNVADDGTRQTIDKDDVDAAFYLAFNFSYPVE